MYESNVIPCVDYTFQWYQIAAQKGELRDVSYGYSRCHFLLNIGCRVMKLVRNVSCFAVDFTS